MKHLNFSKSFFKKKYKPEINEVTIQPEPHPTEVTGYSYPISIRLGCVWSDGCRNPNPPALVQKRGVKQTAADMVGPGRALAAAPRLLVLVFLCFLAGGARPSPATDALRRVSPRAAAGGLCQQLLLPQGYPCTEHTVRTPFPLPVLDLLLSCSRELILCYFVLYCSGPNC